MARGFVYLIAIVDWFSRRVLSWRLSITLETDFCIEALEEALTRFGAPETPALIASPQDARSRLLQPAASRSGMKTGRRLT